MGVQFCRDDTGIICLFELPDALLIAIRFFLELFYATLFNL
jgi:hypothetical protein